jgi:hypothetical protein
MDQTSTRIYDDQDKESESEDEEQTTLKKTKRSSTPKKGAAAGFDFATLPAIDNDGLKYLPKMLYFPMGDVCPVKPQNHVNGESLTVLIRLPNGGFNCIAIPFEAVEEFGKE